MSGLAVFNLLAIVAMVIGLAWWLGAKALRAGTRVVLDEQARRQRLVEEAKRHGG
jgi:hypothetical protein